MSGFDFALRLMKSGKSVRRLKWPLYRAIRMNSEVFERRSEDQGRTTWDIWHIPHSALVAEDWVQA